MNKIKCELSRSEDELINSCWIEGKKWITPDLCWDDFKKICPALAKGLRKGQSRPLILTQIKNGIKLEVDRSKK